MIPLLVFLLACAAVYLGAIEAAFSALMRLSLRLIAERSGRPGHLSAYLDDPVLLFVPVRLLLGLVTAAATALMAKAIGAATFREVAFILIVVAAFIVMVELLLPLRNCRAATPNGCSRSCCRLSTRSPARSGRSHAGRRR